MIVIIFIFIPLAIGQKVLPITVLASTDITDVKAFCAYAQETINAGAGKLTVSIKVSTSEPCTKLTTDGEGILEFYKDWKTEKRIAIGPTCASNFYRFAYMASGMTTVLFNIIGEYTKNRQPQGTITVTARTSFNIVENIAAIARSFSWDTISVMHCDTCYKDDLLAPERNFTTIRNQLALHSLRIAGDWLVRPGDDRISLNNTLDSGTSSKILIAFMGNDLLAYTEFMAMTKIRNLSDYTIILMISQYQKGGVSEPWATDPTQKQNFDGAIVVYNEVYDDQDEFFKKFPISDSRVLEISAALYESLFIYHSYAEQYTGDNFYDFDSITLDLSEDIVVGPFGQIFFNNEGFRLSGYKVGIVKDNATKPFGILGTIFSQRCTNRNCMTFSLTDSTYTAKDDQPNCLLPLCITSVELALITIFSVIVLAAAVVTVKVLKKCIQKSKSSNVSWNIPLSTVKFLDVNDDGSQHISIQSLHRKIQEKETSVSSAPTRQLATIDQIHVVAQKYWVREPAKLERTDEELLSKMKSLMQHDNINNFIGVAYHVNLMYVIWNQCYRGSLADVVLSQDKAMDLTSNIKGAFVRDILKGLDFLHNSELGYHGWLSSITCMVDSHWIVKLSGYCVGRVLIKLKYSESLSTIDKRPVISNSELHYFAPELRDSMRSSLHGEGPIMLSKEFGQKCDMYSFGVVLYEILYKRKLVEIEDKVYEDCDLFNLESEALIPTNPELPDDDTHNDLKSLIKRCWKPAADRPDPILARKITDATLKMSGSLVDQMMKNMEMYTVGLENLVKERTAQLEIEQRRGDELLTEMLPRSIAETLKQGLAVHAVTYKSATILYSDIVGFTSLCSESQPMEVVALLSGMYQRFDLIISQQNGYKMETIGDAYCVAAGLPIASETEHVKSIAMIALLQREFLHNFMIPHRPGKYLNCRWGFNTGSVFSGVVGISAPRYACFGPSVSVAAKMENTGEPDRIQMTLKSQQMISNHYPELKYTSRGHVKVDGLGTLLTYWLEGVEDESDHEAAKQLINEELGKLSDRTSVSPVTSGYSTSSASPVTERIDNLVASETEVKEETPET